ncbi:hypothetical protein PAXRUDRAFT_823773 [Paxillus rubicundulus Ve08.2h10]|uniref:Uncharacterized protein n=1 Tax=Paxillus rubicundulus Ve08.2h10 TaxID=930991 RepID=A0A0D0DJG7_9AGAM|nr:hypothetical protein PAXRUDRAFT_823773 [Paxillus rubicundulus Ve08.2h10]
MHSFYRSATVFVPEHHGLKRISDLNPGYDGALVRGCWLGVASDRGRVELRLRVSFRRTARIK